MKNHSNSSTATGSQNAAPKVIALADSKTVVEIDNEIRLHVRRVNALLLVSEAVASAKKNGNRRIFARHGGSVCNGYGYPAETEGAVCVALPDGRAWCSVVRLAANKVSLAGVFRAVTGFSGAYDKRFSAASQASAKKEFADHVEAMYLSAPTREEIYSNDSH